MALTHCLLLRLQADMGARDWATWARASLSPAAHQVRVTCTAKDENDQGLTHVYVHFEQAALLNLDQVAPWEISLSQWAGHGAQASRLELVLDCTCASPNAHIATHYTVQTDPAVGWEDEIAQWYAQEHMPGLAMVEGCVCAQRYINHDHGPRSFACYDLTSPEVMGSPDWLAVRASDWSSRCRPYFTNTRRTFFQSLHTLVGAST
jgi:hypothetical protein